jgi:hypothetical protein
MKTFSQFNERQISPKGLKHIAHNYGYSEKGRPEGSYASGDGHIDHKGDKIHHFHPRSGDHTFSNLNDLGKHLDDLHQQKLF